MRHRWDPRTLFIAAGVALLTTACGDGPAAPASLDAPPVRGSVAVAGDGLERVSVRVFTVQPQERQEFSLGGGNKITFDARSICEPQRTSYGPGTWDAPCDAARRPVTITARSWYDAVGHPHVEFAPRLRFNPAAGPVTLYLKDKNGLRPDYAIVYCPDDGSACHDEAVLDPSLTTYRSAKSGNFYFRRIKHFSGYNIASGRSAQVE